MTSEPAKTHTTAGDLSEFSSLIEPYRQELHLYCYRLLGSLHDAEDLVQETMLRAWQYGDTFKGQSSLRTWLYKIAPRQRAILLLSDVLDWHASEIANLLSISVSAVKSALHRARVRLSEHYHVDEQKRGEGLSADTAMQVLLERYLHAWDTQDVAGLVALMREDATFTMPPSPSWYQGREAIRTQIATHGLAPELENRWFFLPTGANGGPAFAVYRATGSSGPARAFGIQVLTLEFSASDVLVADVTTFLNPSLFPSFGFPPELSE